MADSFHRLEEALAERYALERELGAGGMATGLRTTHGTIAKSPSRS